MSETQTAIEIMAARMYDEVMVSKDLDSLRENVFRTQFKDSFCYSSGTSSLEGPVGYWKELEKEWKKVSDGAPVPTKYRTNKSVILKAWRIETRLSHWYEEKGGTTEVLGKTAVQQRCMKIQKIARTAEGQARAIIASLEQYAKDTNRGEFETCLGLIHDWIKDEL